MASIPGPRDTDAEDVALKLEVAQTQWARGDHAEALKWLRKAADAAFDADDDKRGIELSKLAAELTAQDKAAPKPKPKLPPPRDPIPPPKIVAPKQGPPAPQARPAAPAPVQQRPAPPAAEPSVARRSPDAKLSSTSARRAAAARAAETRSASAPRSLGHVKPEPETAPAPRRTRASRKSSPDLDDESTREYIVADVKGKAVDLTKTRLDVRSADLPDDEEWPTEVGDLEEDEAPEHTEQRQAPSRREPKRRDARAHGAADAMHELALPVTQALRVAVGRAADGRVVVRVLDGNGLREGERDAVLVALTSESLSSLFTGG
jgi:hypothetical protein